MRRIVAIGCAVLGASLFCLPAVAQQKTVKACQEEWRANKEANQAKGITEKAYVAQCRAGTAAAPKPAAAEKKSTTAAPSTAAAGGKTVKACQEEWRANKAANQAKGITEKAYVAQCRTGTAAAQPAPAPMAPPPARSTEAPAPARTTNQPPAASTAPTGANQYSTETQAKLRCLGGTVVWANFDSKIYHFNGCRDYGHTKTGAYMCERDATSQGMRAAKNEKHP
jgi:hypothetical protein